MFPVKKQRAPLKKVVKSVDTIPVFCKCRMPENTEIDIVQCSNCAEWYHVVCVDVPEQALNDTHEPWACMCRLLLNIARFIYTRVVMAIMHAGSHLSSTSVMSNFIVMIHTIVIHILL